jgi:C1A family cysteine protease
LERTRKINCREELRFKIKLKGACGSCWAHATVETVEAHVAINSGVLLDLSVQ